MLRQLHVASEDLGAVAIWPTKCTASATKQDTAASIICIVIQAHKNAEGFIHRIIPAQGTPQAAKRHSPMRRAAATLAEHQEIVVQLAGHFTPMPESAAVLP